MRHTCNDGHWGLMNVESIEHVLPNGELCRFGLPSGPGFCAPCLHLQSTIHYTWEYTPKNRFQSSPCMCDCRSTARRALKICSLADIRPQNFGGHELELCRVVATPKRVVATPKRVVATPKRVVATPPKSGTRNCFLREFFFFSSQ